MRHKFYILFGHELIKRVHTEVIQYYKDGQRFSYHARLP